MKVLFCICVVLVYLCKKFCIFSYVIFQILPTVVDIIIAIVYFITAFNYIFGLVMFLAMAMYLGKLSQLLISSLPLYILSLPLTIYLDWSCS